MTNNSKSIYLISTKMLSLMSDCIIYHHAKFQNKQTRGCRKNGNTQSDTQTTINIENYKYRLVVCPVKNGWLYDTFKYWF